MIIQTFLISLNFLLLALGANPSLTAAVVVLTGLVGANFVQAMLDRLGLFDPIARGIATASRYVLFPSFSWIALWFPQSCRENKEDCMFLHKIGSAKVGPTKVKLWYGIVFLQSDDFISFC